MPTQTVTEMNNSNLKGVAKEIVYHDLPAPPLNYAEYLLWAAHADDQRRTGTANFYGHSMAESMHEYMLSYAESEQDIEDAREWIKSMPDREMDLYIDISGVKPVMRRFRKEGEMVSTDYLDCACKTDYIRGAPRIEQIGSGYEIICARCRMPYVECPFSLVSEVMQAGLPFDEHAVRTILHNRETVPPPF